jgi:hypothetical protein
MNIFGNQSDVRSANLAVVFLVAGLLVVGLLPPISIVTNLWLAASVSMFLSVGLEGTALVLGVMGRRYSRARNAAGGAVFLMLFVPLVVYLGCLFYSLAGVMGK